ncbi:Tudor domain containing 1 [Branchiostoma belcheri]|nr:Tudor domain containing 1 [Branchiostoma belcheri]
MMEVVKKCDICQEQQHALQCKDCGKDDSDIILLCESCHHAIHRGRFSSHKVDNAPGQEIRDFSSSLDSFKSKSSELRRRLEEVCNSRRDLLKYTQIHESHIKEVATKLQQKIKSQAEQLLSQVQQVSAEKNEQLSECEEMCRDVMTQHQALCEEADGILGNPEDSLQDKTQKVAEFQGKLELPSLREFETKFTDVRIQLVCDVSSVLTAISEWQLTVTPAPSDNLETEVGSTLQVTRGGELSVWVESRMSAKGVFYVRQDLDVPTRETLSAMCLHIRRAGALGTLGEWTGSEGSLCAVRHPGDMGWYRGLVEELRKDKAAVRLLDYGTVETVPLTNLAELPANLPTLPFQAVACTFFKDETEEIPREARWLFSDLAAHKKMKSDTPVPLWKVDLQDVDGSVNIAERVITAVKDKEAKSETVSCRDIRLKENAEDGGALTVIRTNAAAKDPSPEPCRSDSPQMTTLDVDSDVLTRCADEEDVSVPTSMPPQAEMKTTSDFTSEGYNSLDTFEVETVSDKEVGTCPERNDEMVASVPPLEEEIHVSQGADTVESWVPNKPASGTGVFTGTVPRILARGEPYFPPQPTSESGKGTALESVPDMGSSSQGKGADARPAIPDASRQFHHTSRDGNRLDSFSDMSTTERSQRMNPLHPWERTWHGRQGDGHMQQEFRPIPGPQPPRSMYPPPGIPAPPHRHSAMNRPQHHFTPVGGMPTPGDPTQSWQGNIYSYLEGIVSSCDEQLQPYPGMDEHNGTVIPPTTLTAPMSGFQDFGCNKSREGFIPIDESIMSRLTSYHGPQKTSDAWSSVSNGNSPPDKFSTKDRPMALASAANDNDIVSSATSVVESTMPVDQESYMVSSDVLYSNGADDVKQETDLPAPVSSVESKHEEADQTTSSGGILPKEETYPTESTAFPSSDAVSTTSLSAVDVGCIKEKPGSNQATGGNSLREETTEVQPEEFSASGNSILETANQSGIALVDNQHTEGLSPSAMLSDAANMSAIPDCTSAAAMSMLYGSPATEVIPEVIAASSAEEIDPQPQPFLPNGSSQHGHQNVPEQAAALVSSTEDVVIEGEVLSDEFSPASDGYDSPLPVNPVLAEGNEAEECSPSVDCGSTDVTDTKLQPTGIMAETTSVDHTYAAVQHIADTADKTAETSSEGSAAKLQDCSTATCSGGNSGEETNPGLCKSSGTNCASDIPSAIDEQKENSGRLAMVSPEMQVTEDGAGIGTSGHPSQHKDCPLDRPSCMGTSGCPEPTADLMVEDTDKPAVVPNESLKEGFVTGVNMKACVAHPMESDGSFWIQNSPAEDKNYKLMMDEMRAEAPLLEAVMEEASCSLGLPVCAVSAQENMWYRGRIEKKFSKTALVRFVDLGKAEEIAYVDIKPLPAKYQHMDFQVQRSWLAGVNTVLSEKQVELFNKLTANKRTLWTQVTCVLPSGECTVRLWDESSDVELSINQQVAETLKAPPDACVYNQHGRGSTTRSLHVPGFQHGQFHSSPPHHTPAHLGATNMEPMAAENKATSMTSGSSEDWDDAIDDWTEGNQDNRELKDPLSSQQPVLQQLCKQQLAEGTSEANGFITATDETEPDSTSVSGSNSPARSVQSARSVFDEDDWVEGEDPLSQRSDLGSLQETTQPGPPNTQDYLMQSGDTTRQPATESRSRRNGTGARSRQSGGTNNFGGACHLCGQKGHKQTDCPSVNANNGRREQKNGRKGGRGRRNNRW